MLGIRIGVYTDQEGEPSAVMINARQIFNFMVFAKMIKGRKGGFVQGADPPRFELLGFDPHAAPESLNPEPSTP